MINAPCSLFSHFFNRYFIFIWFFYYVVFTLKISGYLLIHMSDIVFNSQGLSFQIQWLLVLFSFFSDSCNFLFYYLSWRCIIRYRLIRWIYTFYFYTPKISFITGYKVYNSCRMSFKNNFFSYYILKMFWIKCCPNKVGKSISAYYSNTFPIYLARHNIRIWRCYLFKYFYFLFAFF